MILPEVESRFGGCRTPNLIDMLPRAKSRAAIPDGFTVFGAPQTKAVGYPHRELGEVRPKAKLCNKAAFGGLSYLGGLLM